MRLLGDRRPRLPYGGYRRWLYTNSIYTGSRTQPEVQTRYLSKNGPTETTHLS